MDDSPTDAGRAWYNHLSDFLQRHGYTQSEGDPCLYTKVVNETDSIAIAITTDDGLISRSHSDDGKAHVRALLNALTAEGWRHEYENELREVLGVEFDWQQDGSVVLRSPSTIAAEDSHANTVVQVIPGLFITKFDAIKEADSFTKLGMNVGLVVNAGIAGNTPCPTSTGYYGPGVEVLTIELLDDPTPGDAKQHFLPTNAKIQATLAAGKQCVIHCVRSVSRGPVFVIAYLMQVKHLAAYEAAALLKNVWEMTWPCDAFVRQLLAFEYELLAPERAITGPKVRGYLHSSYLPLSWEATCVPVDVLGTGRVIVLSCCRACA